MNHILRNWKTSDVESLVEHANNYNIAKWLTNQFPYPYDKEAGEVYINSTLNDNPQKNFAIEVNGEAVGSIGIFPQADIHEKSAEIGYWLSDLSLLISYVFMPVLFQLIKVRNACWKKPDLNLKRD